MKNVWTILCSQAITDTRSNNVSLINIIERMDVTLHESTFPEGKAINAKIPLEIMSMWEKADDDPSEGTAVIELIDATGKKLGGVDVQLDLSESRRCRTQTHLDQFPITGPGRYVLRVAYREHDADEARVENESAS